MTYRKAVLALCLTPAWLVAAAAAATANPNDILVGLDEKVTYGDAGSVTGPGGKDAVLVMDVTDPAHPKIRAILRGFDRQQPIRSDPAMAVAKPRNLRLVERHLSITIVEDHEIVPGAVHLGKSQHRESSFSTAAARSPTWALSRPIRPTRPTCQTFSVQKTPRRE